MSHSSSEKLVKAVHRKTRRKYSAEEKIRIVLEGLRGEDSIAELCRREGLNQNVYYRWSKEFLEAGKQRLVPRQLSMDTLYWVDDVHATLNASSRAYVPVGGSVSSTWTPSSPMSLERTC
jgi:transposase-like protein